MATYLVKDMDVPEGRMVGCPLCGHAMEDGMELVIGRNRSARGWFEYALAHKECVEEEL